MVRLAMMYGVESTGRDVGSEESTREEVGYGGRGC